MRCLLFLDFSAGVPIIIAMSFISLEYHGMEERYAGQLRTDNRLSAPVSVTDRCNYRCQYCMPPEGVEKRPHEDILSLEELAEIAGGGGGSAG